MKVQVVDLKSGSFKKDFTDSLKNTGFAVIVNHGIPFSLIRKTQAQWREFFLSSDEYKNTYVNPDDRNMGYKGYKSETAVGSKTADLKSFYHYKPGSKIPYGVEHETFSMFYLLSDVGFKLLEAIDEDTKKEFVKNSKDKQNKTILRVLHYPALDFSSEPDAIRAAAHEDINLITLLVAASAPGLQVLDKDGNWLDVPYQENSIICNVGDMLELATDGAYKSTTHRVINPNSSSEDRISIPLFIHPTPEFILKDEITAGQFLKQRIEKIYGSK